MNAKPIAAAVVLSGAAVAVGQFGGTADIDRSKSSVTTVAATKAAPEIQYDEQGEPLIPDVIVWDIYGWNNFSQGSFRAYSIGTESCNIGTAELAWFANNNQHPVIGQNMFRLADGPNGHPRFEQIGQAWLKHGFCALSQFDCGPCQPTNCNTLGIGCSDPYSAGLNANQSNAGPKWQVNATTGFFPYPPADPSYSGQTARRLRVLASDVDQSQLENESFFVEAQYVCPDENASIDVLNARNNVSWRQANMNFGSQINGYANDTQIGEAAIYAWAAADAEVVLTVVGINREGTIHVASRAYDNGDGTWDYEYAVHNQDVHRSIGGVTVPVAGGAAVDAIDFADVDYHSGEPFDGSDWANVRNASDVTWATEAFETNANANAIRWGTMYNFRFTADVAPATEQGDITLDLFMPPGGPNAPEAVLAAAVVPGVDNQPCAGDFDLNGSIDFTDLLSLLGAWGSCSACPQDLDLNGDVAFDDLLLLLAAWGDC